VKHTVKHRHDDSRAGHALAKALMQRGCHSGVGNSVICSHPAWSANWTLPQRTLGLLRARPLLLLLVPAPARGRM